MGGLQVSGERSVRMRCGCRPSAAPKNGCFISVVTIASNVL